MKIDNIPNNENNPEKGILWRVMFPIERQPDRSQNLKIVLLSNSPTHQSTLNYSYKHLILFTHILNNPSQMYIFYFF
jgi:hypothetical protein